MHTLAIDIGGTKVAYGLVDASGELVERIQIPTPPAVSVGQFANALLTPPKAWLKTVDYIGVSCTGLVSDDDIRAINPVTFSFPAPFNLKQTLTQQTGIPVSIINDAQAAALYEHSKLDEYVQNIAYITVSTGVGGGLILNGSLFKGTGNLAGHIGHMVVDSNGPLCGCGRHGCVESIASGKALQQQAQEHVGPDVTTVELFKMAARNTHAQNLIDRSALAIATLCVNVKASLDIDLIVLGGGIGLAEGYVARVKHFIALNPAIFQVDIQVARGDHDACLLGAAIQRRR